MQEQNLSLEKAQATQLEVSNVLRNTYGLLGLTLLFSAFTAFLTRNSEMMPVWITLGGFYGLLYLTNRLRNSPWGLVSTFALTGFMGMTLGSIISHYLNMRGGAGIVAAAFSMTALVFCGLSAYVLTTRKDMSFLSGFIVAGVFVLIGAMLAAWIFEIRGLWLAISAAFVLFSSACILYQTSAIIHGGERNYIMATISLYVSIYNLFVSLLQLIGAFSGDD